MQNVHKDMRNEASIDDDKKYLYNLGEDHLNYLRGLIEEGRIFDALNSLIEYLPNQAPIKIKVEKFKVERINQFEQKYMLGLVSDEEQKIIVNYTGYVVLVICSLIKDKKHEALNNMEINFGNEYQDLFKIVKLERRIMDEKNEWRWTEDSFKVVPPFLTFTGPGKILPRKESIISEGLIFILVLLLNTLWLWYNEVLGVIVFLSFFIFLGPTIYSYLKRYSNVIRYEKAKKRHFEALSIYGLEIARLKSKFSVEDLFLKI